MKKITVIALNTFKEVIRDKILYNLLFFALILIVSSLLLRTLTIRQEPKIVVDLGLASISIFGTLIAIFIGIGLVSKEIDKRTIYTIISKPVYRYQFLLGKYLGLILTLLVNVGIMTLVLYGVLLFTERSNDWTLLISIYTTFLELMVITAIAILFSTFTTTTLSAIFSLSFFVIGHLSNDLITFGNRIKIPIVKKLMSALYYTLPNLENFNLKTAIVYGENIGFEKLSLITGYAILYIILLLLIAGVIFQMRDFK